MRNALKGFFVLAIVLLSQGIFAGDLTELKNKALLYLPMEKGKILAKPASAQIKTVGPEAVFVDGKKGQALVIDREGVSIKGLEVSGANLINNEKGSIVFWMRPLVSYLTSKKYHSFFAAQNKNAHYIFVDPKGGFYFQGKIDGKYLSPHFNFAWWKSRAQWSTELWYHMAVTWDKAQVIFYVNGVKVHSDKKNLSFAEKTDKIYVGWKGKDGSSADALLDDFYIFDKVLSLEEVGLLMKDK